ncbi:DNA repair protein RecO [Desulfobulbus alkaliphilus]|uniref:DNA repair protein RecO n=1 Tax=Desulfobulbus alkaliphilus TaxID=869814 RepID=UPI001966616C|nr:DNA repair protein RecO [Desulfobulbus alkaliphilus]MBM9537213.1 DNA repair protein RecO [Desulfobulbus alkaliphilus]
MIQRSTCAIVLRVVDYAESDKLVTLYSRDLGRITGIAKGAKKSKRRFVNKLEEFSLLQLLYQTPRIENGLFFIAEAELLNAYLALRTDYRRYTTAAYLNELTVRFTREADPDSRLFTLLQWALASLERNDNPAKIIALFHLRLLAAVGYRPELSACGSCRLAITTGSGHHFRLVPGSGALICTSCHPWRELESTRLSPRTVAFLSNAQSFALHQLNRLQPSRQAAAEAMVALHAYTLHLLQQDIQSWPAVYALYANKSCPTAQALTDTSSLQSCGSPF